jgi:hypothetical protein
MKKTYTQGKVEFGFSLAHHKWQFTIKNGELTHQFFHKLPHGRESAVKVAGMIDHSFKTHKVLTGLVRANINRCEMVAVAA